MPWDKLEGQIYLGTAGWIEKMRKLVESKLRSDQHGKAQRLLPALLLRSSGHVSNLVRKCERELARDKLLQQLACAAIERSPRDGVESVFPPALIPWPGLQPGRAKPSLLGSFG